METIQNRLRVYNEQTQPLIDLYSTRGLTATIDGIGDIGEVTERILAVLPEGEG